MNLMKYLSPAEHKLFEIRFSDKSFKFILDGFEVIHLYSKGKLYQSEPKTMCINDLGAEQQIKHFGNDCNVMADILICHYERLIIKIHNANYYKFISF